LLPEGQHFFQVGAVFSPQIPEQGQTGFDQCLLLRVGGDPLCGQPDSTAELPQFLRGDFGGPDQVVQVRVETEGPAKVADGAPE
jgi:hypothetical protein